MRRATQHVLGATLLLGAAFATPSLAGTIYAAAEDPGDTSFFFQINPTAQGGYMSNFGKILINANGSTFVDRPITAMGGHNGQLQASSVHPSGGLIYYSDIAPQADGTGGFTSHTGELTSYAGGDLHDLPVAGMAAVNGNLYGVSYNDGAFNYFYTLNSQADGSGGFGGYYGGVTVGENGGFFKPSIDTMASFGGQLYGTTFYNNTNLFYRITPDADGTGAYIEGIDTLTLNGFADGRRINAMVGGDDGLYGVSWDEIQGRNYFSKITPNLNGFGGFETQMGFLAVEEGAGPLPYKITALGYLPSVAAAVPEPATWAMMIMGFGLVGAAARRRRGVFADGSGSALA